MSCNELTGYTLYSYRAANDELDAADAAAAAAAAAAGLACTCQQQSAWPEME